MNHAQSDTGSPLRYCLNETYPLGAEVKVFVSWSKSLSAEAAQVFRRWLPEVMQEIETWASEDDIDKGSRWSAAIAAALEETAQGILCVTPENLNEPWLSFEAGALAKTVATSTVSPVLLGLDKRDLTGPLAEFQATSATEKDDMLRLVSSLNKKLERPLDAERLNNAFERTWDDVLVQFEDIAKRAASASGSGPEETVRTDNDVLSEVLDRVRTIERRLIPRSVTTRLSDSDMEDIEFEAGERVLHDKFGVGTVVGVEGFGRNLVVKIDFDSGEAKRLVQRFNKLTKY